MKVKFRPRGVCSELMTFELEDGIIKSLSIDGGCSGNLQGISCLALGMPAEEVIKRLKGIKCGWKATSCPDQLALALEKAISEE